MTAFDGFVYAIQAVDGGPVKIGWSQDPGKRLMQLQGSHHSDLRIVHQFQTFQQHELQLHEELDAHRVRGEWFADTPDLWAAVDAKTVAAAELLFCWRAEKLIRAQIQDTIKRVLPLIRPEGGRDEISAAFADAADSVATIFDSFCKGVVELVDDGTFRDLAKDGVLT